MTKLYVWSLGLSALLACACASPGQSTIPKTENHSEKRAEAFLESLNGLQIEYRADIQLTAIEQGKVLDPKLTHEILIDLIQRAPDARVPFKLKAERREEAIMQTSFAEALDFTNVDGLSVRTRAIRSLMTQDPAEAWEKFQSFRMNVPQVSCKSVMMPEVHDYYELLSTLGNVMLTRNAKSREQFLLWAQGQLQGMSSPMELLPAGNSILNLKVTDNEFSALIETFSRRAASLAATDREMNMLENHAALSGGMERLARRLREQSWPTTQLLQSYKTFLQAGAKQPVCDDVTMDWNKVTANFARLQKEFGFAVEQNPNFVELRRSAEKGGAAEVDLLKDDSQFYDGIAKLSNYRYAESHGDPAVANQDGSLPWESDLSESLKRMDAWTRCSGPARFVFLP